MPAHPRRMVVKDIAAELNCDEREIRALAREAMARNAALGPEQVDWPVLRDRETGKPITDYAGWAYAIVAAPPDRRGRPRLDESNWAFRRVKPPRGAITLSQRYLLTGCVLGINHQIITAIAAEAGIVPGAPVRALGKKTSTESVQVTASNEPGPVLVMLLRPEGTTEGWHSRMGDHVQVLVQGLLLLPAAGPIGYGPVDRLLWDPEALCWCGEPVKARSLLELRGNWGLDHCSQAGEPAAARIHGNPGLRLDWVPIPSPE
jgi:hypothetical protein